MCSHRQGLWAHALFLSALSLTLTSPLSSLHPSGPQSVLPNQSFPVCVLKLPALSGKVTQSLDATTPVHEYSLPPDLYTCLICSSCSLINSFTLSAEPAAKLCHSFKVPALFPCTLTVSLWYFFSLEKLYIIKLFGRSSVSKVPLLTPLILLPSPPPVTARWGKEFVPGVPLWVVQLLSILAA